MSMKKDYFYVAIQVLIFILFCVDFTRLQVIDPLPFLGILISFLGLVTAVTAILQLKTHLTPLPTPKKSGTLITTGMFGLVRHPIYLGIIMILFGISIYYGSVYKLILTFLMYILFDFKSKYEEELLHELYPEYEIYKNHVAKIIPFLK